MPVSVTDIAGGLVAPAVFAGVVIVLFRRLSPEAVFSRCAATFALAGGFVLGYALLGLGEWSPKFFWHWLPYVVLLSLPVGPLLASAGKLKIVGVALMLVLAIVGGWLLVPTWPHLEPSRTVRMAVWIPAIFVLAMLLESLNRGSVGNEKEEAKVPVKVLAATLTATMFFTVVIIFLSGSLRFTQLAAAGAASMLGLLIAVIFDRKADTLSGIAPAFAVLIGGLLLVARIDSFSGVPLVSYLLPPLAPLTLWIAAIKPFSQWKGWSRWMLLTVPPLVVLVTALAVAMVAEFGSGESY